MSYGFASILLAVTGGVLVIAGLLFFRHPRWLLGWLIGTAVFGVILAGLYALVIAKNLASYQSLEGIPTVATISTQRQTEQIWRVTLETEDGRVEERTLRGDQWQVDVRMSRFSGPLGWLGISPAYRLDSLSGRYTSLEQSRTAPQTEISLAPNSRLDLWQLDRQLHLPFVEGVSGKVAFMPMRDGATFKLRLSAAGLVAVPANDQARAAVQLWDQ
ncbi:multidrug transporter [Marinobacter subterrani]|uniref:Multidrug transporter n=1 Tax=Marinobacter subterrani TaxID=1658765 RepID=A0A0J7J9D1_9GAMM|nr:multidrug transporter [Marinobacter subterrani]KMQ74506.1 hypothetical protein Msub_10691 [Marinobacter subterrani]